MDKKIAINFAPRSDSKIRKVLFYIQDTLSYRNYFKIKTQSVFYRDRWKRNLAWPIRLFLNIPGITPLILTKLVGKVLEFIVKTAPAEKESIEYILNFKPDVLIASPCDFGFSSADLEYLRAAKKLGIPTVIPVFSWDNLTTKGLIHIKPDKLLVWNKVQSLEAQTVHNIKKEDIEITGSPFFDSWFQYSRSLSSKLKFCKKLGLNPNYPIITYLGSSVDTAGDERWLITKIREALDKNKSLKNTQIIVRPHPHNSSFYQNFTLPNLVVYPKRGTLPDEKKARQLFYDCLMFSLAVVGVNTSGMIDAMILNRPTIAMITKQYSKTQDQAEHFQQLITHKAIAFIKSPDELVAYLALLLEGKDRFKENRLKFIRNFIRPKGLERLAGEIAANIIEKLAQQ
ncbi:CDP-glycerol glycerophosphotransferase family protein [Candidatus Daviesbacteria bacterium]|nr:CDP-glycerol glycerophosphotransferase family protein [Candidatus Daviesbacteria bacterium]